MARGRAMSARREEAIVQRVDRAASARRGGLVIGWLAVLCATAASCEDGTGEPPRLDGGRAATCTSVPAERAATGFALGRAPCGDSASLRAAQLLLTASGGA